MKRLLILSGKGGTGKTTVSAAFIRLAQAKAIADCDVDAPNLHLVMEQKTVPQTVDFMGGDKAKVDLEQCRGCGSCESHCRFGAIKMTDGRAVVNEYACEGCGVCCLVCPEQAVSLMPDAAGKRELYLDNQVFSTATLKMGRGNSGKLVTDVKMAMLKHAPECELAIADGSPGIGCPVISSISGMDLVLIVAEPSKSGISDLKRLVKTADTFQVKLAVCVNKYDTSPEMTEQIEAFCRSSGLPFAGKIPFDPEAVKAVNSGCTIADTDCQAGRAVKEIYKNVMGLLQDEAEKSKKENDNMKIAVSCNGSQIWPHFGHCENFMIYEANEGKIESEQSVPNPGHRPGFLPNFLADMGVEVMIAGGMGGGAVDIFNERGVEVVLGAQGDAKAAAEAYLRGELESTGSICHEHEHADQCGEH